MQIVDHPERAWRPTCYSCLRPCSHCVCDFFQPISAHCNILIIQHPNERRKYYSTAKLVLKAITNSKLLRGLDFERSELERNLTGQIPLLLFPSNDAQDCEVVQLTSTHTVIVVDGTWAEACKLIRHNPILTELPCLTFKQPLRSTYRIRKQPREFCLSTIESVAHLLKLNSLAFGRKNEGNSYDSLFKGFDRMVEQQLDSIPALYRQQYLRSQV